MNEGTFLDPLRDARDLLIAAKGDLAAICRALHLVGNTGLADRLAEIAQDMNIAATKVDEGSDMALDTYLHGATQASANMVKAALAVAGKANA